MQVLIIFAIFFFFIFVGVPIAHALFLATIVPLLTMIDLPLTVVAQKLFTTLDSYGLLAVPFFIIAGGFMNKGGVSKRLVDFANSLVGWLPGGLAVVTFFASAFFGAISGSSIATVIAIGSIMMPAMKEAGYPLGFSLSTVAIAGILGIIVPPSIPMVLYGTAGSVNVGELFMGGFIPGFILAGGMSIYAILYGMKHLKATQKFHIKEVGRSFIRAFWALMMPAIILGGIYGGILTPTEAAAVAIVYAIIVGVFVYKELSIKDIYNVLKESVVSTGTLEFIVAGAACFGYLLTRERLPVLFTNWMLEVASGPNQFYFICIIFLLIIGCFMDVAPAVLLLTPIFIPVLTMFNVNPVAFGVIMIITLGLGLVTPPVGINLYTAARLENVSFMVIVNRHLLIYFVFALATVALMVLVPQIVLFLPNLLM